MRFLTDVQIRLQLQAGRPIEQLFPLREEGGDLLVETVRIEKERDGRFSVHHGIFVDPSEQDDLWCVGEMYTRDDENPEGTWCYFDTMEEALEYSEKELGTKRDMWLGSGMIQDLYGEWKTARGS